MRNERVNHKIKESQIKFSERIWLGAPGINLEADTFFCRTSHQNEEKLPRHEQTEGGTPLIAPPLCRTVMVLQCHVIWQKDRHVDSGECIRNHIRWEHEIEALRDNDNDDINCNNSWSRVRIQKCTCRLSIKNIRSSFKWNIHNGSYKILIIIRILK